MNGTMVDCRNITQVLAWIRWRNDGKVGEYADEPMSGLLAAKAYPDGAAVIEEHEATCLLEALRLGTITASGLRVGSVFPESVPTLDWNWMTFEFPSSARLLDRRVQTWTNLRIDRRQVEKLWPAIAPENPGRVAERLLLEMVEKGPILRTKDEVFDEINVRVGIGRRAFDRVWASVEKKTGVGLSKPGPKSKRNS
jgi:hypothetical protein